MPKLRLFSRKRTIGPLLLIALFIGFSFSNARSGIGASSDQQATSSSLPTLKSYGDLVNYLEARHKAPFLSSISVPAKAMQAYQQKALQSFQSNEPLLREGSAGKVNQDYNPWPKVGAGVAVNPRNGRNVVVMSNDFRRSIYPEQIYHLSNDRGTHWSDDVLAKGINPTTQATYDFQSNPGAAYDSQGHSYFTAISGNLISDANASYQNYDTQIDLVQGFADGSYSNSTTTPIDYVPCNGDPAADSFNCPGLLDKPFVTVDNVPGSPNKNTIYVYYTYFCLSPGLNENDATSTTALSSDGSCTDGGVSIPAQSSAILEAHADGPGLPFSSPRLVSGTQKQAQFSSMVIDSSGQPHIFFNDYSDSQEIALYESTLSNGGWAVRQEPVVKFQFDGIKNPVWKFRDSGAGAPGCAIDHDTAYCAFTAAKVEGLSTAGPANVYLASIPKKGTISLHRVNNDPPNPNKAHFFPWTSTDSHGKVYVGWFDNRNDPFNTRVEYFVGMSKDHGRTFPRQQAVSKEAFNPCAGYPLCSYFGDYYQLVTGPDGVTHATWSDTRDGISTQLFTRALKW